jgi:hypothetical protein
MADDRSKQPPGVWPPPAFRYKVIVDEAGKPMMIWTLANASQVKVSGTDLKSDENEVAVEIVELAHEGCTAGPG